MPAWARISSARSSQKIRRILFTPASKRSTLSFKKRSLTLLARRRARVEVRGAGRVGAAVASLLAAAGVGRVRVRDSGRALDFSKDFDGAVAEFQRAIALEPQRPELHDDLGTVLVQKSDSQDAADEFSEALRLEPKFGKAHFHLGVLQYQQRSLTEAAENLRS